MSVFSSNRERRLWACALAVMVAIYATLGLARGLADALMGTGLGEGLFILACLMVLAAVVTQGLTRRPGGMEIGVALGVAAAYVLVFARMAVPTERSHLVEYGVVAFLVHEALRERIRNGRRVPSPALLAVLAGVVAGVVDEGIQWFVPSRVFDPVDMLFNALAAVMSVGTHVALIWVRGRSRWPRDWRGTNWR